MSMSEDCAIMRQVQAEARRRYLARIDRALSKRQDSMGDLYRAGVNASASNRAERQAHRLSVERAAGGYWARWQAACSCGQWHGEPASTKYLAERDCDRERERMYRPLTAGPVTHSAVVADVKGAA